MIMYIIYKGVQVSMFYKVGGWIEKIKRKEK
jgi:hypothetical protein